MSNDFRKSKKCLKYWTHVCVCLCLTPSQLGWFCNDIQRFINSSNHNLKTHTHMQKTDHYIHTQWHTHLRLYPPHQSQVPQNMISFPPPVYSGWERKKKLKWKNRVLKMMYCGNCAESTYEPKNKSRQIVCKGVNELKNALKALKRLGSWNMAMKSAEKEGQRFSKKSKILAKQREQGSTADARGTLFIKAPRSKGVNAYRAWKCGYAFWTLQEKAKSLKCWDLLTS